MLVLEKSNLCNASMSCLILCHLSMSKLLTLLKKVEHSRQYGVFAHSSGLLRITNHTV
jgi:hypothetical protein